MFVDLWSQETENIRGAARGFEATVEEDRVRMISRDDAEQASPRRMPAAPKLRRVKVSELLAGEREAILEHDGQEYRLRITNNGKLILTK
jgi:hemin uptake protein HemP